MTTTTRFSQKSTRGQLERTLSQRLQKLYRECLEHAPGKVSCQLLKDKLTIVIDNSLSRPEQLILQVGNPELARQMRSNLDDYIRPKIISLVEEVLDQKVLDLLSDTTLETERTGFVVILSPS